MAWARNFGAGQYDRVRETFRTAATISVVLMLGSSASRLVTFMLPAIWLSTQPWLTLDHVWYLSVASVWMQAGISAVLLAWTLRALLPRSGRNRGRIPAVIDGVSGLALHRGTWLA